MTNDFTSNVQILEFHCIIHIFFFVDVARRGDWHRSGPGRGKCGRAPGHCLPGGRPAKCDPDGGDPCCSDPAGEGLCGRRRQHCLCAGCVRFYSDLGGSSGSRAKASGKEEDQATRGGEDVAGKKWSGQRESHSRSEVKKVSAAKWKEAAKQEKASKVWVRGGGERGGGGEGGGGGGEEPMPTTAVQDVAVVKNVRPLIPIAGAARTTTTARTTATTTATAADRVATAKPSSSSPAAGDADDVATPESSKNKWLELFSDSQDRADGRRGRVENLDGIASNSLGDDRDVGRGDGRATSEDLGTDGNRTVLEDMYPELREVGLPPEDELKAKMRKTGVRGPAGGGVEMAGEGYEDKGADEERGEEGEEEEEDVENYDTYADLYKEQGEPEVEDRRSNSRETTNDNYVAGGMDNNVYRYVYYKVSDDDDEGGGGSEEGTTYQPTEDSPEGETEVVEEEDAVTQRSQSPMLLRENVGFGPDAKGKGDFATAEATGGSTRLSGAPNAERYGDEAAAKSGLEDARSHQRKVPERNRHTIKEEEVEEVEEDGESDSETADQDDLSKTAGPGEDAGVTSEAGSNVLNYEEESLDGTDERGRASLGGRRRLPKQHTHAFTEYYHNFPQEAVTGEPGGNFEGGGSPPDSFSGATSSSGTVVSSAATSRTSTSSFVPIPDSLERRPRLSDRRKEEEEDPAEAGEDLNEKGVRLNNPIVRCKLHS